MNEYGETSAGLSSTPSNWACIKGNNLLCLKRDCTVHFLLFKKILYKNTETILSGQRTPHLN